jgi:Kyanoviridae head maturation protease
MERVSHLITDLHQDGNNFIGKAKVLDTPYGKIVKSLIDENVKLGVSSRGMGTLRENSRGVQEVGDDFVLCTGADIVADPSAPSAFVQGIREGKEWVFANGLLTEKDVTRVERAMKKLTVTESETFMISEFSRFLKKLSN